MALSHLLSLSFIIALSQQVIEQTDFIIDGNNKQESGIKAKEFVSASDPASYPEILFLGNSTMVPIYKLFIADQEPYVCTNIAVWGNTINQQLSAWNALTDEQKNSFDYVLVQIGLNDLNGNSFLPDYQRLISQINTDKKATCEIIAATESPARKEFNYTNWQALNASIRQEGATPITGIDHVMTTNTTDLDVNEDGYLDETYDSGDGIHPNAAGNVIIKNNYLELLKNLTVIPPEPPVDTTVIPVPPDTTVIPVPPDTTIIPVPPDTTVIPVPPDTTVTPVPPDTTVIPVPPDTIVELSQAPSVIIVNAFSENNISISWQDNSTNEDKFIITRYLASNPEDTLVIEVNANDTTYTDDNVEPGNTYVYSIKAVNEAGYSEPSSEVAVAAISFPETKRIREGLIAFYNFGYNPDYNIYDISGDGDPLNLQIVKPSELEWNEGEELVIKSNNLLISTDPAKKIIDEVKLTNEVSVECWIRPAEPDVPGIGRIISIGTDENDAGFMLNQEFVSNPGKKSFIYSTRLNTESTSTSGFPALIPKEASSGYINLHHIVYVRNGSGQENIFVDGEKSAEGYRSGSLASWNNNYYLRLGNESDLEFPWNGSFYRVSIYNIALTAGEISDNYNAGLHEKPFKKIMNYDVVVSPNPFQTSVSVGVLSQNPSDMTAPASLRILDIFGRVLFNENIFDPAGQFTKSFDFSGFSSGIYLLQVISGNKQVSVKLIKN